jgi:hypothetical protein
MLSSRALLGIALLAGCAAGRKSPPSSVRDRPVAPIREALPPDAGTAPPAGPAPVIEPGAGMQMKEVSEKAWLASTRQKLAEKLKVEPTELRFSPSKRLAACVREVPRPGRKPAKHPPARRYQIVVVDPEGARRGLFEAVALPGSDEPPGDFRFLAEDRLIYEVLQPPPPPPPPPAARKKHPPARRPAHARPANHVPPTEPALPHRLFVIQPVERRQRRIRCEGVRFAFTAQHDHFAFVTGKPEAAFVSVDGVQVYPRRGRSVIASDLAWSKDGRSLAFLETPVEGKARLVLLAEFDNPTGDTSWDLPPAASTAMEGARVVWGGSGKLVVAKPPARPLFSASFVKDKPRAEPYKNAGP